MIAISLKDMERAKIRLESAKKKHASLGDRQRVYYLLKNLIITTHNT